MELKGDFHIHSNNSDGRFDVKELIDMYKDKGYTTIAITDHDTMQGCDEAVKYGKLKSIKVIPGIEVSTKYNGEDVHILGYFREEDSKKPEMIEFAINKKQDRINRCEGIVNALKKHFNIEISAEKLLDENKEGMIGRPHIAKAIIEAGYGTDMNEIFDKYLNNSSPAYIPSSFLTPQEGINLLKNNNAVVVLAHPVLLKNSKVEDLLDLFDFDGVEAVYSLNSDEDTEKFKNICSNRGLLITGGSDFHDFYENSKSNIGSITLDNNNTEKLINKLS